MKLLARVFFFFFVLSVAGLLPTAEAQSTLNFPRQFLPAELQSTGFAVANPSAAAATVTLTLYNDAGAAVSTSTQTVPAGGQLARLGSELFTGAAAAGWVQAVSSAPGLTGFWLSGDFATYTDGAESAGPDTAMVLPIVTPVTEISIANTSDVANSVRIRLIAADGSDVVAAVTRTIPKLGVYQAQASAVFAGANFAQATHILLTADSNFAATSLVRGFVVPTESAVLNAVVNSNAGNSLHFAHVISGSLGTANYSTIIGVTNLTSATQTVTLSFNPEPSGQPTTVTRNLPAGGALRDTSQNIFSLSSGFRDGWVKVSAPDSITGFVAYGDTVSGGLAVVPPQTAPRGNMLFAHVAGLPAWYTGIALLNASDAEANVEVSVLDPAGEPVGSTAKFTVASKHKTARLLGDVVAQANTQNGGFVIVRSSAPLFGLQLFGGTNGKILSNIASGRPAPSSPGTSPNPTFLSTNVGRVTLDNIEWDSRNPHNCTSSVANCFVPRPGFRVLRLRFNLFDRAPSSIGYDEAIGIVLNNLVNISGANFAATTPFLGGTVQGPPDTVDTSVTYAGGTNFSVITLLGASVIPPYNVIYVGFEIPANATGLKLTWGTEVLDLGF